MAHSMARLTADSSAYRQLPDIILSPSHRCCWLNSKRIRDMLLRAMSDLLPPRPLSQGYSTYLPLDRANLTRNTERPTNIHP